MINLFNVASQDQSLNYLFSIFGSMNGVITCPDGSCSAGTTINLLGSMFKTFNGAILTLGVLLAVYVTIVGVVNTAHEGEFMGKQYNNIWIPVRIVMGIALMIPTASGFSLIQIIMMWVIVQGISAADTVWSTALTTIATLGSPYAQPTVPQAGTAQAINGIFQGLACSATANFSTADPNTTSTINNYYCTQSPAPAGCGSTSAAIPTTGDAGTATLTYPLGPANGSCGSITYCNPANACASDPTALACLTCTQQVTTLQTIIATFAPIATAFAQADNDYRTFYNYSWSEAASKPYEQNWQWIKDYCNAQGISQDQCCVPTSAANAAVFSLTKEPICPSNSNFTNSPDGANATNANDEVVKNMIWPYAMQSSSLIDLKNANFISIAQGEYSSAITGVVTTWVQGQNKATSQILSNAGLSGANNQGWIMAGTYYYTIAQMNNNVLAASMPTLTYVPPNPDLSNNQATLNGYRNNATAASTLLNVVSGASTGITASTPALGQIGQATSSTNNDVNNSLNNNFQSSVLGYGNGTNPLASLQSTGESMLISAEVLFAVLLVITLVIGIVADFNMWLPLGEGGMDPLIGGVTLAYFFLAPLVLALLGVLISMGGLLAVYTPIIPYVIFTMGAIGWMLSTIEAMVAGPIVALGIMSPKGQHEILGKAEHGLNLLLNIFLRPSLMVFGMFAAMLLASTVVSMINAGFSTVQKSVGGSSDPLTMILFLFAYDFFILAALNKCFSAIYVIPNNVLTWIGGPAGHEEASSALGEVKGGVSQGGQAMEGTYKAGQQGGQSSKDALEKQGAEKGKAKKGSEDETGIKADKPPGNP